MTYETDHEAIERLDDGPKKSVIKYLTEKLGWYAVFKGKGNWTLIEPDSGGVYIQHNNYRKVADFMGLEILTPIAWHIHGYDYVGKMTERLQDDILKAL